MRKLVTIATLGGAALALAAVALAGGGYGNDYGTTTPATTTATTSSTVSVQESESFNAKLTAAQEVPKTTGTKATAAGNFSATTKEKGSTRTLRWTLTFRNLTGKVVAAHVHSGKKGVAGPVLVPLCGPCRNGQTGTVKLTKAADELMESGGTYVNVHTAKNAAGEIRGQVRLVGKK